MAFQSAPKPKSVLGYHRVLSPNAGVRVSPLCLGGMGFGDKWKATMGECDKKATFEILDYFFDQGGNFIDTANGYQAGESEEWIGEWMVERQNRDQIVLATKYTLGYLSGDGGEIIKSNTQGNHAKSLRLSFNESLKRLQTDYIDVLYVHCWDYTTSVPELMQSLNRLVSAGKVLYLGISDTPAWIVSKANEYARSHALTQFSVYQGNWSASVRDFEREILPMCDAEGMAIAPFGVLGRGKFKSREQRKRDAEANEKEGRNLGPPAEKDVRIAEKLEDIANKKGTSITSVALAYIMHKAPYVFPIIGGRKVEHLKGNIEALSLEISDEEIDEIEAAVPFDAGFPMDMIFGGLNPNFKYNSRLTTKDIPMFAANAHMDSVERVRPIRPRKE